jgi:hypothetical protein
MEQTENHAIGNARAWLANMAETIAALASAEESGDDGAGDEARDRITESPLSVLVRDGWRVPGADRETAEEYEILLSTGGPALRIFGKLSDYGEPDDAEIVGWWGSDKGYYRANQDELKEYAARYLSGLC